MKTAIIIGHNAKDKGFFSPHLDKAEFDFFSEMQPELSQFATVYYHNPMISSYTERMRETASRINKHDYDLVIVLHFNAFNTQAHGVEALYFHSNASGLEIARNICGKVSRQMGIRNRGPKPLHSPTQRGYWEVFYPKATTINIEPFFGDNPDDCQRFHREKYINILREITGH